jgi:RHS repeat-associated protein
MLVLVVISALVAAVAGPPPQAAASSTAASSAATAAALASSPQTVTRVDSSAHVTPDSTGRVTIPYCPATDPCAFASAPAAVVVTGRGPTGGGPPIPANLVAYNPTTTAFTLRALSQSGTPITTAIDVYYHAATSLTANEEIRTVAVTTDASGFATVGYATQHGGQAAGAVVASGVSPDGGANIPVSLVVSARTGTGFTVRAINQSGTAIASTSITLAYYAAWASRIDYGTGWVAANATTAVTTDASGYATVSYDQALPSIPTAIVAVGVAPASGGNIAASLIAHNPTATNFRVRVLNQTGAIVASLSVTLSYRAVAAIPDPTLFQPDTLHSNGADLSWSRYTGALSGAPFAKYEVHRFTTANFTPSASTLLMSTTDIATTTYRDTTARPGGTFYYKVVANSTASAEVSVTLPADGQATKLLQPDPADGKDSKLFYEFFANGNIQCGTYGIEDWMRVGSDTSTTKWRSLIRFDLKDIPPGSPITSATMSLWKIASNAATTVRVYRATRDWVEGSYGCFNGATWYTAANGVNWTAQGADYDSTEVTNRPVPAGEAAGWHTFDVKTAVQPWVNGDKPNLGLLLRVPDESGAVKNDLDYASSDRSGSATEASHRPKLAVTYADGSHAVKPTVSLSVPIGGPVARGTIPVTAAAADDRRVDKVEFYLDGGATPIVTDTAAPWTFNWDTTTVPNGTHSWTAKAYDDAGNITTSTTVSGRIGNNPAPTTSITSPAANATGLTGTVPVSTSNAVASGLLISSVQLYVDGALYATSTTSPYSFSWNTLDAASPAYDGSSHTLATKVYDTSGQVATSATVTVTTGNTTGTRYRAGYTTSAVPQAMTYTPGGGSQLVYPVDVTVKNDSAVGWSAATTFLRYRWYSPNPADPVVESGNIAPLGLAAGTSTPTPVRVNVTPPTLPDGVDAAQYRLRFDVLDTSTSPAADFAGKGNPPNENPVVVNKALSTKLGIEKYYSYVTTPVGAGMTNVVNVANGNSMLTLTPLSNPGRGLHTVARLTYNSLEEKSESPVGTNFSLSISSLVRLGNPLDVHPNNADTIAGRSNKFITFVDGDGSLHRFDGVTGADGITYWNEPPGVHLYLRSLTTDTANPRYWALTRPDRVTFYFNSDGYPTFVTDRNGNTITFTLTAVAPGDDPGGPKFHITKVTDAAGRAFDITYLTKATARKAKIRGKIARITDHLSHAIEFAYYDDGNLQSVTEKGGSNADGTPLPDRSWSFTYTTPDGSGPTNNPNSQSSLVYSVRDPLNHDTVFSYNGPGTSQNRWKLARVTDRAGNATTFDYDITNRITTVAAPTPVGQTPRTTRYGYDSDGKPVSITNPLNQVTGLEWNADFAVTKITEPNTKFRRFDYNDNGYLTDVYDQLNNHTILTYQNLPADANDTSTRWRAGRTIPHLSQLASKQDPVDVAAGNSTKWTFGYDGAGNLTTVTEPLYPTKPARYTYNADGTVATSADFKGNVTTFKDYDANGLPKTVVDATDNPAAPTHPTKLLFDDGGRLLWVQDPRHASYTGGDPKHYRTYFYYDSFNRLGRQSTPKSTSLELGQLIWSDISYDANDNTVKVIAPHFGTEDSGTGDTTSASHDAMDRQTLVTGPDTSADPAGERTRFDYDEAGRVKTVMLPLGVKNGTPNNTRTINHTYDALDRVIRQTRYHQKADASIETLTQHACYDNVGNLVSTTAAKAALASVTCPADHNTPYTTVYGYDFAHRLTSVSDPLSHNTAIDYDANGNRKQVTDAAGNVAILRYDSLNRLTRTEEPYLTGATPRTVVTLREYDENSNQTRVISPRGYDASPDKVTFSSYTTSFSYDQLNRLTRVALPTDTTYPTAYYVHRGYDVNGNLTVSTLPDTHPNLVDVPASAKTQVEYFDLGWIAASNDPANPKVHFDYNARGQQTRRTPETSAGGLDGEKQIQWAYFADGQLKERTDQKGQLVSYTYDADNQLLTSHDGSGLTTPAETAVDTQNAYDDLDRLTRSDNKKQIDTSWTFSSFGYDANDNVTDTEQNGKETAPGGTVTAAGRKQHTDYDQADWITTQLDYGQSTGASDDQRITNSYNAVGRQTLRKIEQNNGSGTWTPKQSTVWDYFANGLLKQLTTRNDAPGAGTVVESHVVDYLDPAGVYVNGNRTKDVYTLRPNSGSTSPCYPSSCSATYTYDPRDRLVNSNDGHGGTTAYTLDGAGNILTETVNGASKTYTYTGNQLQQVTSGGATAKYWYDDAGRLACVTTSAGSSADCAPPLQPSSALLADYSYDYLDRLATYRAFTASNQSDKAEYTYDALDRTVSQTELHPSFNGTERTTAFSYLGLTSQQTREVQTNSTGTVAAKDYSYDALGRRLSMTNTPYSGGTPQPATTYTYGYDTHGSASQLLDPSGATKASYGYRPYGQPDTDLTKGDTNATTPFNPFRYSAKRLDTGSATYDMGARRFGPDTSRFLNQDLFYGSLDNLGLSTDPLTNNRYALAAGNPVSYAEWDGHMPIADGGGGTVSTNTSQCYEAVACNPSAAYTMQRQGERDSINTPINRGEPPASKAASSPWFGSGGWGGGYTSCIEMTVPLAPVGAGITCAATKQREEKKPGSRERPFPFPFPLGPGGDTDEDGKDCLRGGGTFVSYGLPDWSGRATGVIACLDKSRRERYDRSKPVDPVGWKPGMERLYAHGHLLGHSFKGANSQQNIVPILYSVNTRMEKQVDRPIRAAIDRGNETVFFSATTHYRNPFTYVPDYIDVHARSSGGTINIDIRFDNPDWYSLFP